MSIFSFNLSKEKFCVAMTDLSLSFPPLNCTTTAPLVLPPVLQCVVLCSSQDQQQHGGHQKEDAGHEGGKGQPDGPL